MKRSLFARFHGLASNLAHAWLLLVWPLLRAVPAAMIAEGLAVFLHGRRFSLAVLAPLSPLVLMFCCLAVAWLLS